MVHTSFRGNTGLPILAMRHEHTACLRHENSKFAGSHTAVSPFYPMEPPRL